MALLIEEINVIGGVQGKQEGLSPRIDEFNPNVPTKG
jgi:hypothetical protein